MDGSFGFSMTQSIGNYPESSFTVKNKWFFLDIALFFFEKNWTLRLKKKKTKWICYLEIIIDTYFIPLQNEHSPILVGLKLGKP